MCDGLGLFGVFGLRGLRWIGRQTFLRCRRWVLIHCGLDFISNFLGGLLEFFDTLAEAFGKFGQLSGSKKDQDQGKDENNLSAAKVKQAEHAIHA